MPRGQLSGSSPAIEGLVPLGPVIPKPNGGSTLVQKVALPDKEVPQKYPVRQAVSDQSTSKDSKLKSRTSREPKPNYLQQNRDMPRARWPEPKEFDPYEASGRLKGPRARWPEPREFDPVNGWGILDAARARGH